MFPYRCYRERKNFPGIQGSIQYTHPKSKTAWLTFFLRNTCLCIILIYKITFRPSMRPSVRASVRPCVRPSVRPSTHQRTGQGRKGQERQTMRGSWNRQKGIFKSSYLPVDFLLRRGTIYIEGCIAKGIGTLATWIACSQKGLFRYRGFHENGTHTYLCRQGQIYSLY